MIYIASPYTHRDPNVREFRYHAVACFCGEKAKEGLVVYSPIVHWHQISIICDLPFEIDYWHRNCRELLAKADELWIYCLPGWSTSKGITAETMYWREELNRNDVTLHCPPNQ